MSSLPISMFGQISCVNDLTPQYIYCAYCEQEPNINDINSTVNPIELDDYIVHIPYTNTFQINQIVYTTFSMKETGSVPAFFVWFSALFLFLLFASIYLCSFVSKKCCTAFVNDVIHRRNSERLHILYSFQQSARCKQMTFSCVLMILKV